MIKNTFKYLLVLLLLASLNTWAAGRMDWIKHEYNEIQANLKSYQKQYFEFIGTSTEGSEAVAYTAKNKEIKHIDATLYGETGKTKFEFYYDNNQVFFVLEQRHYYNSHIMMTEEAVKEASALYGDKIEAFDAAKTQIEEWRYYFERDVYGRDKIVKMIGPNKKVINDPKKVNSILALSENNLVSVNKNNARALGVISAAAKRKKCTDVSPCIINVKLKNSLYLVDAIRAEISPEGVLQYYPGGMAVYKYGIDGKYLGYSYDW